MPSVDSDFLALPLGQLADAALSEARSLGASHADLRVHRLAEESISLRDAKPQSVTSATRSGFAVRVLVDGVWGFASSVSMTAESAVLVAKQAVLIARSLAPLAVERVQLADEPVYPDAVWVGEYERDPFSVPTAEKVALLADYCGRLLAADPVAHATAHVLTVKEQSFYADLAGSRVTQQRVRLHPQLEATTVDQAAGVFETMRTLAPPVGRGWEYLDERGSWDWADELARMPQLLAEKAKAPSVAAGPTDLVIAPSNLWLTIHESIGHATEYDRAIGYEAAYAGTSFATPDKLGALQYGSPIMHVTADRNIAHGLATVGWDDEGVATGRWDIVKDGLLVGYQLDRAFALRLGLDRSNGCSYADSAHHVPIQRMANISLEPDRQTDRSTQELIGAVEKGIYIEGDKSWSIDMQRYNFQFTGQRFWRIEGGKLAGQLRDVAYQATTTDFWGSMEAVGGESTWVLGGAFNCGKAQPGQVAAVSHGCPSALFRQVRVLNTAQEGKA
ncbi:peptidase U62 modulator of DNA gyrase [Segniliparus rotundus DSM 44985]|uniref:Peptidase U62 modulator of DNA gyrase n=1 Tax=Segniliparus rotundus (strain ATCC BAA-972 / CDC 1076 / CIP 108378 / DSM 44985 / JCM 13578) TaxID=640132 RepID=D6ZF33_SEGRD|nr:TldD/PmbA family protein [Segniliparus rotundus]ADG97557.1 peptidase U62 modulator of DNA gyrase [Segniliparus rotundus DSM 44985]